MPTYNRKKIWIMCVGIFLAMAGLLVRTGYLMTIKRDYYGERAARLHERERDIKAARGRILDRNGTVLASNRSVCTISVIHNQITEPEKVIDMLVTELGISEETARSRVEKVSSIERVKTNVDKETGDAIRAYGLSGVKVDEDYKRYYPFGTLASTVLGFTGADNQGIIGLEVTYEEYLKGTDGKILTLTDARGIEIENAGETRQQPVNGYDLYISIDADIQQYCEQAAKKAYLKKEADRVSVVVMNPNDGEILAMVNYPEFDLNDPFSVTEEMRERYEGLSDDEVLNKMWRNPCVSDTYEPGSTFKIITAAAALEKDVVSLDDPFYCPGYRIVADRRIRCAKVQGHGSETFETGIMNSCNPVFIEVGERIGVEDYYKYFNRFSLAKKTGIDLPGEAATIMHDMENVGQVELATISFGQSFQITPVRLLATVSSIINGGTSVTPHFGVDVKDSDGNVITTFDYEQNTDIVSEETSETMQYLLERVVSEGGGTLAQVEGYEIGGKTATSQTLPRSDNRYISSFLGFAPADDPQIIAIVIIDNPVGTYYGGTIAAPVFSEIMNNILPGIL